VSGRKPIIISAPRQDINIDPPMITLYLRHFDPLVGSRLAHRDQLSHCVRQRES
jgi:hypothetical protein